MADASDDGAADEPVDNGAWFSESLDVVSSLSRALCDIPIAPDDSARVLHETSMAMQRLIDFDDVAFVMCDDDGLGFHVGHCAPGDRRDSVSREVDRQIEEQVFAWVLRQNRSVVVPGLESESTLMMHVLATDTNLLGMFVGRLPGANREVPAASQKLATIVLLHCASVLESRRLQGQLNESNRNLEATVVPGRRPTPYRIVFGVSL